MTSPFVVVLTAVGMALIIGVVRNGPAAALYDALLWGTPVFVGYFIASGFVSYSAYQQAVRRVLVIGGLVLGAYGILQFINPPPWDRLWMAGAAMSSIGRPEPFMIRVFGPLNAPGPYAIALMVAITMSIAGRGFAIAGPATAGLLLSLVRSAWGGLAVGLLWFSGQTRGRERVRLLVSLGIAGMLVLPFVRYEPIQSRVGERAETLTSLEEDNSMDARLSLYVTHGPRAVMENPLGRGLGAVGKAAKLSEGSSFTVDSGLFAVLLALGIPGGLLYLSGLGMLLYNYVLRRQPDRFLQAVSSCALAILVLSVFANQFDGFAGVLLWLCIGSTVCGRLYYAKREADLLMRHVQPERQGISR